MWAQIKRRTFLLQHFPPRCPQAVFWNFGSPKPPLNNNTPKDRLRLPKQYQLENIKFKAFQNKTQTPSSPTFDCDLRSIHAGKQRGHLAHRPHFFRGVNVMGPPGHCVQACVQVGAFRLRWTMFQHPCPPNQYERGLNPSSGRVLIS